MKLLTQPRISFEFFPPKSKEGMQSLSNVASLLAVYDPHFYSVTFGAGGSTREGTIETVKILKGQFPVRMAPHLTCIGATKQSVLTVLDHYKAIEIKRIVALRGDLPQQMTYMGDFTYADQLVSLIRERTGDCFHIEVAAYPEIHPQALSAQDDLVSLKAKYEAGADSAITQYFFNPDAYFYYLEDCARLKINMPVIPGIMPITQFSRLARFSDMCGAEIPRWIRKRLESYGDDAASIQAFGFEVVEQLCRKLIEGGAPGLHFYTMNRAETSIALLKQLGLVYESDSAIRLDVVN